MKNPSFLAVCIASVVTSSVSAVTLSVSYDAGVLNTTTAIPGGTTNGAQMAGMSVTAFFSGGTSQTGTWLATGPIAGGVTGVGWSLIESGDTFLTSWTLNNTGGMPLTRLLIDAGPGNTVFDTIAVGSVFGTAGSNNGFSFSVISISAPDQNDVITATYRDAIALGGAAPAGDLFRRLDINFVNGLSAGSNVVFRADTDNITGDLRPVRSVPDAMSTLFGLALVSGLMASAKRFLP